MDILTSGRALLCLRCVVTSVSCVHKAVKKLLHFANSKRETPEKQSSDHQSAELLIGLGGFGSRTSSHDSGRE